MTLHASPPSPETLVQAAFEMEPIDLPVDYGVRRSDTPENEILITKAGLKVGPLFGVPNPDGPFGQQSWLASYNDITLEEIARGAPKPPKDVVKQMQADGLLDSSGNIIQEAGKQAGYIPYQSYIYGKTPNQLVPASQYKFGPNAKDAIILEGVNFLFRPQTQLIAEAVQTLLFRRLPPDDRIRTYGAMIFGAFRPQPALFWAGMTAETLQQAAIPLNIPLSPRLMGVSRARSEFGAHRKGAVPHQPLELDIVMSSLVHVVDSLQEEHPSRRHLEGDLRRGLKTTLQETHLEELYISDTKQRTARAMDDPYHIGETLVSMTPYRSGPFHIPLPKLGSAEE